VPVDAKWHLDIAADRIEPSILMMLGQILMQVAYQEHILTQWDLLLLRMVFQKYWWNLQMPSVSGATKASSGGCRHAAFSTYAACVCSCVDSKMKSSHISMIKPRRLAA